MMKEKAITLIEVLIVVVILSIIAAIAYPRFQGMQIKVRLKELYANTELIAASEKYFNEKNDDYFGFSWDGAHPNDGGNNYVQAEDTLNIDIPPTSGSFCRYYVSWNSTLCILYVYSEDDMANWLYRYDIPSGVTARNTASAHWRLITADSDV